MGDAFFSTTLQVVTAKPPAAPGSQKKAADKTPQVNDEFKLAKAGPKIVFKLPYLTNNIAVQRGQAVRLSASIGIQSADVASSGIQSADAF